MNKLKLLIATSRPISWINTAFPFTAGYIMLGGDLNLHLLIGTVFFFIPYNLLMYGVNDVYDYESDIRNPRKGGVEGAVTPKKYHRLILWTACLASVPFAVWMLYTGTKVSGIILIAVLFFVVAYSIRGLRFKEIPLLDSFTSSIHFVGPLLYAYGLLGASKEAWIVALAFFLWGMASHAFGAVQDIIPDRQGNLSSIATVFGARTVVLFSTGAYVIAAALIAAMGTVPSGAVALCGVAYAINTGRFYDITDASSARSRKGWRNFLWLNYLTGAVVTMACIAVYLYK